MILFPMILTFFPHRTAIVQPEEIMLSQWREERETMGGEEESRGREGGADEENRDNTHSMELEMFNIVPRLEDMQCA